MKRILTLIFILFVCLSGKAQEVEISGSRKAVRTSGDVLAFVTPVASLTTVLVLQDWKGLKQGALAGVSTIGMTYVLKYLIKKERPDGSDKHSFPSMHTSVSFTGAAFIQRRYGWKWGIPAYAIASYVGWSRTYAKKQAMAASNSLSIFGVSSHESGTSSSVSASEARPPQSTTLPPLQNSS